jgi:D-sedoheptulose 7-phosphate isomerase
MLEERIREHIAVARLVESDAALQKKIGMLASAIIKCYEKGGKLILMGNGGSAADAQHIAAEFLGRYLKERKAIPSIALTTNSSAVTAIGNDYGYELIFKRQLEAWLGPNDVVLGISTSGNSKNVVAALEYAKSKGAATAALVGSKTCKLDSIAGISIKVPSDQTPRIQEMHMLIMHTVCELAENALVEKGVI